MTRPETCGAAGGAISLWVKVIDCPMTGGIISSQIYGSSGIDIYCASTVIWYDTHVLPIFQVVHKWSGLADLLTFDAIIFFNF